MKKLLVASASVVALLGLAACGDTDGTTTQGIDDPVMDQPAAPPPASAPPAGQPSDPGSAPID